MSNSRKRAKIVSGVLFSSTLFVFNQAEVHALAPTSSSTEPTPSIPSSSSSTPVIPSTTSNTVPATSSTSSTNTVISAPSIPSKVYTGDKSLDNAIKNASSKGISVVETPESTVSNTTSQKTDYNKQTTTITNVTNQYVADKATQDKQNKAYQEYLAKQAQYQKDLASYQAYLKAKATYDQQMKVYNMAKANYDQAYATALTNTKKDGYLLEVLAQNLIFKLEPNATQTITGKLLSDNDIAKATKNSVGWIDPATIIGSPTLATRTTKGKENDVLVAIGDTVVVDYSGLENSSFSGFALKRVRYTYKLVSTSHYSGKVILHSFADPTVTSTTFAYNKDGKTQCNFEWEMIVQLFDAQNKELIPDEEHYALTSFASLNSINGKGEYVSHYNGQLIPINGSTITVQNDRAMNYSNKGQNQVSPGWDDKGSPNAYIGAIVGKSTQRISFHFGNTIGYADWFAFNSDVKASGITEAPPIKPIAPKTVVKPVAPIKVTEPQPLQVPVVFFHKVNVKVTKPLPSKNANIPIRQTKKFIAKQYHRSAPITFTNPTLQNYDIIYNTPLNPQNNSKVINIPVFDWKKLVKRIVKATIKPIQNKPTSKNKGNKTPPPKPKTPNEWFNYNTGVNDFKSGNTDVIEYIKSLGKKADKKYKGKKSIKDREIAQAIADSVYHNDGFQTKFNHFGKPIKGKNNDISRKKINKAHASSKGQIDLAHLTTTLASLENQGKYGKKQDFIKLITTLRGFIKIGEYHLPIFTSDKKATIRQQNSFIGDLFTDMPVSDVYTDMDIMILSKHPKYKNMPMDQRILAYYSQDVSKVREKLFQDVYGKNKKESENNFLKDLVSGGAVLSILALYVVSAKKGKLKNIPKNVHLLDKMLLSNRIDRFKKHPVKAIHKAITKHVTKPVKRAINKYIIKPVKKYVVKPIVSLYHKTTRKINQIKNRIHRFFAKPKQSPHRIIRRVARRVYHRIVPRPVRRAIYHSRRVYRKYVRPIFRNIFRPKVRHHRRRRS